MNEFLSQLKHIKNFVFDIDGVFTNGNVLIDSQGNILRQLYIKDCYAVQYASKKGYKIFIITGGDSKEVEKSLYSLGATKVCLKSSNKELVLSELVEEFELDLSETLYMGDDIPDYNVMKMIRLATCPKNSAVEIYNIADYISPYRGGEGCVRDIIEKTLRVQNNWFKEGALHW